MESNPYSSPSSNLFGSTSMTGAGTVTPEVVAQLQKTKPWVRLMSVMFYIGGIVMVLAGAAIALTGGAAFANMPTTGTQQLPPGFAGVMGVGLGIFYAVAGFLYLYPAAKLGKYASKIGDLLNSGSSLDLEAALNQQRGFWKFVGVITVIGLCLMVVSVALVIIGAVVGASAAASR